jgi:DNA mismatch repair ATPase MutS
VTDENVPLSLDNDESHPLHRRQVSVKYLYTVKEGISSEKQYGLRLAAVAGFPEGILQRSEEISKQVSET